MRLFIVIILILLSSFALGLSYPNPPSSHCRHAPLERVDGRIVETEMHNVDFQINFELGEESLDPIVVASGDGVAFSVPLGTEMIFSDISRFVYHCVDGVDESSIIPIRVVEVFETGTGIQEEIVVADNSVVYGSAVACRGGHVIKGRRGDFPVYAFTIPGKHKFRVEYASTINADKWNIHGDFIEVHVGPGSLEVISPDQNVVGLKNNVYERENSKSFELFWELRNEGGIDLNLLEVIPYGCDDGDVSCSFPDFAPGTILEAEESYFLKSVVEVQKPAVSPEEVSFGIDVNYSDVSGWSSALASSKLVGENINFEFVVEKRAYSPYELVEEVIPTSPTNYEYWLCVKGNNLNEIEELPIVSLDIYRGSINRDNLVQSIAVPASEVSCEPPTRTEITQGGRPGIRRENEVKELIDRRDPNKYGVFETTSNDIGETFYFVYSGFVHADDTYRIEDKGVVLKDEEPFLNFSLHESQDIVSARSDIQSVDFNAFSGVVEIDNFAESIVLEEDDSSRIFFKLANIKITTPDGEEFSEQGPVNFYSAPGGDARIWVDETGSVFGLAAGGINRIDLGPFYHDLNVAWIDKEKYMLEMSVGGGSLGLCRNLSGESQGLTGEEVIPRVLYDWEPVNISWNACDVGNENFIFCDSTQFSISLIKRLDRINELALAGDYEEAVRELDYSVYLMKDGFSTDFVSDFDFVYSENLFFNEQLNYEDKWRKYFSDNTRLNIVKRNRQGDHEVASGVYRISIEPDFENKIWEFFDSSSEPLASFRIILTRDESVEIPPNIFYELPLNGTVGVTGDNRISRNGYGVAFNGDTIPIKLDTVGQFSSYTYGVDSGSSPLVLVEVKEKNGLVELTKAKPGQIFDIYKGSGEIDFVIEFSPSVPVPVIMKAEQSGNGSPAVGYSVSENGTFISGIDNFLRFAEIAIGDGAEVSCEYGNPPVYLPSFNPSVSDDRKIEQAHCSVLPDSIDKSFSYYRDDLSDAIFVESMIFNPVGKSVNIKNVCQNQGKIWLGRFNREMDVINYREILAGAFEIESPNSQVDEVVDLFRNISEGKACVSYSFEQLGESKVASGALISWNDSYFLSDLRSALVRDVAEVNACYSS